MENKVIKLEILRSQKYWDIINNQSYRYFVPVENTIPKEIGNELLDEIACAFRKEVQDKDYVVDDLFKEWIRTDKPDFNVFKDWDFYPNLAPVYGKYESMFVRVILNISYRTISPYTMNVDGYKETTAAYTGGRYLNKEDYSIVIEYPAFK